MIRTWLFAAAAALGYAAFAGADTDTVMSVCTHLRHTPNSACGLQDIMHGLGAVSMAGGLTGLAGNAAGGVVGAAAGKPAGFATEGLVDLIAGYLVVHSHWWADNVTYMLR
ncbi:MAG TPA: hypothetical protein HA362_03485 [Nanoarchaeota archaeon]|nr:hypothetical protein [Nanoarchaeota archaeon]